MGLFVGFSVLTIMELVELVSDLGVLACLMCCKRGSKDAKKCIQVQPYPANRGQGAPSAISRKDVLSVEDSPFGPTYYGPMNTNTNGIMVRWPSSTRAPAWRPTSTSGSFTGRASYGY